MWIKWGTTVDCTLLKGLYLFIYGYKGKTGIVLNAGSSVVVWLHVAWKTVNETVLYCMWILSGYDKIINVFSSFYVTVHAVINVNMT